MPAEKNKLELISVEKTSPNKKHYLLLSGASDMLPQEKTKFIEEKCKEMWTDHSACEEFYIAERMVICSRETGCRTLNSV